MRNLFKSAHILKIFAAMRAVSAQRAIFKEISVAAQTAPRFERTAYDRVLKICLRLSPPAGRRLTCGGVMNCEISMEHDGNTIRKNRFSM
jgi:hypothetical protein